MGHPHDDDTFPAGHKFPGPDCLPLVHGLRSAATDDSLLLRGLHLPFGRVLSTGADAVVLAGGTLFVPGRSRRARLCKTEFNGWNVGRHMAADADDVDTSIGLWNLGALHYAPPLWGRKRQAPRFHRRERQFPQAGTTVSPSGNDSFLKWKRQ